MENLLEWIGLLLVVIGQIITVLIFFRKRGDNQNEKTVAAVVHDTQIEKDVKYIKNEIGDPETGLQALSKQIHGVTLNCATVSSGMNANLRGLEKRVDKIEAK